LSTDANSELAAIRCYRCSEPGHKVADCPELKPAATYAEHLDRIALYGQRHAAGTWTREEKEQAIIREIRMWKSHLAKKRKSN
jgi:hypothetical protein